MCKVVQYKVTLPNHTIIEAVPIDPTGEAGGNADGVFFSELWGVHQEAQRRMWTETTLPPGKFGRSFRWVETYAGYSGESILLENLYQQGVKWRKRISQDGEAPMYVNHAARMFTLWNDRGRIELTARVTPGIRPGVVHVLEGWCDEGDPDVNALTAEGITDMNHGATYYECLVQAARA